MKPVLVSSYTPQLGVQQFPVWALFKFGHCYFLSLHREHLQHDTDSLAGNTLVCKILEKLLLVVYSLLFHFNRTFTFKVRLVFWRTLSYTLSEPPMELKWYMLTVCQLFACHTDLKCPDRKFMTETNGRSCY